MSDRAWMERCLVLAARARGRTAPNPMVGAVIVRGGAVLSEGWHRAPGQAHAEVDALEALGGAAPGATMYVNLEPCCHYGRTPPCTDAILRGGIRRVVVAMVDPDPRVSGRGIQILREAGLEVEVGLLEREARALNAAYLCAVERRRPLVVLKAGISLDGRICSADGESRWLTGPEARDAAHGLRNACDAVLVGTGTLLTDDPALTTRISGGRDALPVVLDSRLRCPWGAKVLRGARRPVIFHERGLPKTDRGLAADLVPVPSGAGGLDLGFVLDELLRRGVHSVLVEGGAKVYRSFLDADLVDRVELFVAPRLLCGGVSWMAGPPFALQAAPELRFTGAEPVGRDLWIHLERG